MPQDGCCCKISSCTRICLSRCNWDQSFIDSKPFFDRYILKHRTDIIIMDHSYQNVDTVTNSSDVDQNESLRIPLGSEWDPVKIPKNLMEDESTERTLSSDTPLVDVSEASQQGQSEMLAGEDCSKVRNCLSTVVRRACTRSPRGSAVNSPSRSPTNSFRISRPIVIDQTTLDNLTSAAGAAASGIERLPDLPHARDAGVECSTNEPPVYENVGTVDCLTDLSHHRKSSQHSNPCIEVTLSDTDSVFSSAVSERSGISADRVYPGSEFLTSYEDSGHSSSGSELVNCRLSSSSAFLGEVNSSGVISDVSDFSDSPSVDIRCRMDTCQESLEVNRQLSDLEQTVKSNTSESSSMCEEDGASRSASNLELSRERLAFCTFYFGKMSADEARDLLVSSPVGTFLLRDSADERFLYSISVQTSWGPTSIRIGYLTERFYLDSEPDQMDVVPKFNCVLALVQFYVRQHASSTSSTKSGKSANLVKRRDSTVVLLKPFESKPPSLLHLTRRTIHGQLQGRNSNRLCLIPSLKSYLSDYPYDL